MRAAGMVGLMVVATTILPACLAGSGRLEERTLALAGFDTVDVNDGFAVELARGDGFEVAVTADDNVWRRVEAKVENGSLRLALDADVPRSGVTLRARVALPNLATLLVSGGSRAKLATRDEPRLVVRASGASIVETGGAVAIGQLVLDASGASRLDGGALVAERADVAVSGASLATLAVREYLAYVLSGASRLTVDGHPAVGRAESSGSSVYEER